MGLAAGVAGVLLLVGGLLVWSWVKNPAPPAADDPIWRHRHGTKNVTVEVRRRLHRMLLDHLDLASLDRAKMDDRVMRPKVLDALKRIVQTIARDLPAGTELRLVKRLAP